MRPTRTRSKLPPAACAAALATLAATAISGCGEVPAEETPRLLPRPEKKQQRPRIDLYGDPLPEGAIARCGTVRMRHGGNECSIAFSRDGKSLITANDKAIGFWALDSGRLLKTIKDAGHWPSSISLSADGSVIASGGIDVRLWNAETGKPILKRKLLGRVNEVCLSPDGRWLAWAAEHGHSPDGDNVNLKGSLVLCASDGSGQSPIEGHVGPVYCVAFSPDGSMLASGGEDGSAIVRGVKTRAKAWEIKPVRSVTGRETVYAVAFSPDGKLFACSGWAQPVRIWDVESKRVRHSLRGKWQYVSCLAFSPDGKTLAAGSGMWDSGIYLWDSESGKPLTRLVGHCRSVDAVSFSPDGDLLASASGDGTFRLWDLADGTQVHQFDAHGRAVRRVTFSPDGKELFSATGDGTVRLWETLTGKPKAVLAACGSPCFSLAVSPDGRVLAMPSGKEFTIHSVASGEIMHRRGANGRYAYSAAFSPDGKFLATGWQRDILLWDTRRWELARRIPTKGSVLGLGYVPGQGTLVAASGIHGVGLRFYEAAGGGEVRRIAVDGYVRSFAISRDGRLIAAPGRGGVTVWDIASGAKRHRLGVDVAGLGSLEDIAFSPDGGLIAAGSSDGSVRLWSTSTGLEAGTISCHAAWTNALAFSPDGRLLATASSDTSILLWDVSLLGLRKE